MSQVTTDNLFKFALILIGVVQALLFFLLNDIYDNINALERSASEQKMYETETYARRDDVVRILDAIEKLSDQFDGMHK
jgi:hypothetical protein